MLEIIESVSWGDRHVIGLKVRESIHYDMISHFSGIFVAIHNTWQNQITKVLYSSLHE